MRNPVNILRRLGRKDAFPFQTRLRDLVPEGLIFEISNPVEHYRVMEYGGEREYLKAMIDFLRSDDVLFDVGANIGMVSLHAANRCKVVAFEPDPSFLARLTRNLSLNPEAAVDVLPVAVTDRNEPVTLYTDGAGGNSPSLRHQRQEKGSVMVEGRTLDSLVVEGSVPAPTILKLDVEGAELLALRGASALLRSPTLRALFLEVHPRFLDAFGGSDAEVIALVEEAGYTRRSYDGVRADETQFILERA
jgi:FkbM family methyltransferase